MRDDEDGEDPRAELVRRLTEYKNSRMLQCFLRKRRAPGGMYLKEDSTSEYGALEQEAMLFDFSLFDLVDALKGVIEGCQKRALLICFRGAFCKGQDRM